MCIFRGVLLILTLYFFSIPAIVIPVSGRVTDSSDHPLAYASLYIKGTTTGTNANSEGKFTLDLPPGHYTLICEFLGYQHQEMDIVVGSKELTVDFKLLPEQYTMKEIMIRPGGEDPAYAIIRHAIKMREFYYNQVNVIRVISLFYFDSFICVYLVILQFIWCGLLPKNF